VTHHEAMKNQSDDMKIVNNIGEEVGTTRSLKIFLDIFEAVIETLPKEMTVFNLSKFGAKIEGAIFVEVSDIVLKDSIKSKIEISNEVVIDFVDQDAMIKDFIRKIVAIKSDVIEAREGLHMLYKKSLVTTKDMEKVVKGFRKIAQHTILEEVILSNLTFVFNRIVNKFNSFDLKKNYSSKDHVLLIEELDKFYNVVIEYTSELMADKRLNPYK
ncbi:hypothetical protein, partial [Psychrobacillus psychrotolerans]|uniref:hypothetical protein n=1 Tax=Psychrobacillus psychrotolerans TaxID=126156 RepID=UPI003C768E88